MCSRADLEILPHFSNFDHIDTVAGMRSETAQIYLISRRTWQIIS